MARREVDRLRISTHDVPYLLNLPCQCVMQIVHTAGDRGVKCKCGIRYIVHVRMPFELEVGVFEEVDRLELTEEERELVRVNRERLGME